MANSVQVGLELDGTRATVVTVNDKTVADIQKFSAATAEAALTAALSSLRRADPVRVAFISDGVVLRRVDVTAAALSASAFADLAYAATGAPRDGTAAAGLLFDLSGVRAGLLGSGVAVVAPADPSARLYESLGHRPSEVVPTPLTVGAVEGVSLALRYATAELTLVSEGEPVAFQQLPSGGLSTVEAILGGGTAAGSSRVDTALAGNASTDPIASGELERYLRSVLADVADTLESWARRGERASRELFVYGPGARARSLDVLCADAGLVRASSRNVTDGLVHLPPNERLSVVGAYLAAMTYGEGMPQAAFPDSRQLRDLQLREARHRRRRRYRTFGAAAALLLAGVAGPASVGISARVRAEGSLQESRTELAAAGQNGRAAADFSALAQAKKQLSRTGDWAQVLTSVQRSTPSGVVVSVQSLQVRGDDLVVSVSGSSAGSSAQPVADFMAQLRRTAKASDVVPGVVLVQPAGGTTFSVTFTIVGGGR